MVALDSGMMHRWLVAALLTGCAPTAFVAAGSQTQPQVDNRTPDQVVVDLLSGNGFGCQFESADLGWRCVAPQHWTFYITQQPQNDGSTQILYTSYMGRAFGKPCAGLQFAMQDLQAQGGAGFEAVCNDQTLQFNLITRWVYDSNLMVIDAANDHVNRAVVASKSLREIHALSKADAAVLAGR
jgi:hypothetical protein